MIRTVFKLSALTLLVGSSVACSSSGVGVDNKGPAGDGGGRQDMADAQKLYGTWVLPFGNQTGGEWVQAFRSDGTFQLTWFQPTSPTTSDEEVWQGTYAVNAGSIVFTTQKWSCPLTNGSTAQGTGSGALDMTPYSFSGEQLFLIAYSFPGASLTQFYPWTPVSGSPGSTLTATIGCETDGGFVAEALSSFTN